MLIACLLLIPCLSNAYPTLITCISHAHPILIQCSSHAPPMLISCSSHAHPMLIPCWSHAQSHPILILFLTKGIILCWRDEKIIITKRKIRCRTADKAWETAIGKILVFLYLQNLDFLVSCIRKQITYKNCHFLKDRVIWGTNEVDDDPQFLWTDNFTLNW